MSQTNVDSAQISYLLNILQNIISLFIYSKRLADSICLKCSDWLRFFPKYLETESRSGISWLKSQIFKLSKLVSILYFICPEE